MSVPRPFNQRIPARGAMPASRPGNNPRNPRNPRVVLPLLWLLLWPFANRNSPLDDTGATRYRGRIAGSPGLARMMFPWNDSASIRALPFPSAKFARRGEPGASATSFGISKRLENVP